MRDFPLKPVIFFFSVPVSIDAEENNVIHQTTTYPDFLETLVLAQVQRTLHLHLIQTEGQSDKLLNTNYFNHTFLFLLTEREFLCSTEFPYSQYLTKIQKEIIKK